MILSHLLNRNALMSAVLGFGLTLGAQGQSSLILADGAQMVLSAPTTTDSVYLVIDNPAPTALSTVGASQGGKILTVHEKTSVKWNIGTNTGTYTIPFGSRRTSRNITPEKIPLTMQISAPGVGASGSILFSSYTENSDSGTFQASRFMPSGVPHVNYNNQDNSRNMVSRFWIIDTDGYSTNPSTTLSFAYDKQEARGPGKRAGIEAGFFPQRYNPSAASWSDVTLAGTIDTSSSTLSGAVIPPGDLFRTWTLVSEEAPLPITLKSFSAECTVNDDVLLRWITTNEMDNDYFTIERSEDLIHWEEVSRIKGAGTSHQEKSYSATAHVDDHNFRYYRLKQTDFDGKFEYEDVTSIDCGSVTKQTVELFPNPFHNDLRVKVSMEEGEESFPHFKYQMCDKLGVVLMEGEFSEEITLDTRDLPVGAYVLKLHSDHGSHEWIQCIKRPLR